MRIDHVLWAVENVRWPVRHVRWSVEHARWSIEHARWSVEHARGPCPTLEGNNKLHKVNLKKSSRFGFYFWVLGQFWGYW